MSERAGIEVTGQVQGVGFRPFVYSLATALDLRGFVQNRGAHVFVDVEGDASALGAFVERLTRERPRLAAVERVRRQRLPPAHHRRFIIAASDATLDRHVNVPPDAATCDDCLGELLDPGNRRYRHAFIACTACGPRYSMIDTLPFDRAGTTMAAFPLCAACAAEYSDAGDRRFHAQAICCRDCGPTLTAVAAGRVLEHGDGAFARAAQVLAQGGIVAVKGIGGFHLACDATNDDAVAELRRRKGREARPFAVMAPWQDARTLVAPLHSAVRATLLSAERPIVLLDCHVVSAALRRALSRHVAPACAEIGIFLPYSPVHHLLLADLDRPLVMTSGNRHDEPMACADADALEQLAGIADLFLMHDRRIIRRADDGVVRVSGGISTPIRRGRGAAPAAFVLAEASPRTVLAAGGDLKNTFCFMSGSRAYLSPHVGSVATLAGSRALADAVLQLAELLHLEPAVVAHDVHPDFLSTHVADLYPHAARVAVQHHHAHVLSCVAEHRCAEPVIGVAFDGAGLGHDGAIWGGEFLLVDGVRADRAAHLAYVPQPGGDAAAREPWRMALSHLLAAGAPLDGPAVDALSARVTRSKLDFVCRMIRRGACSPPTSSMGRLFDAVAALVGIRDAVSFEGQAAMELEAVATHAAGGRYHFELDTAHEPWTVHASPLVRAAAEDVRAGRPRGQIAAAFHHAVGAMVARVARELARVTGIRRVALSGGVFQNARLSRDAARAVAAAGLEVLEHRRVPCNDGGLSLGQALLAARLVRRNETGRG